MDFSEDDLLRYALPKLLRQNSGKLPIYKYLSKAIQSYPEYDNMKEQTFEDMISNSIRKNRKCLGDYTSVKQIWNQEKNSLERATRLISHLKEEQINIDELYSVLLEIFEENINVLQDDKNAKAHIRRLIRIYDYLRYSK